MKFIDRLALGILQGAGIGVGIMIALMLGKMLIHGH
jgi:hypothetical protein